MRRRKSRSDGIASLPKTFPSNRQRLKHRQNQNPKKNGSKDPPLHEYRVAARYSKIETQNRPLPVRSSALRRRYWAEAVNRSLNSSTAFLTSALMASSSAFFS